MNKKEQTYIKSLEKKDWDRVNKIADKDKTWVKPRVEKVSGSGTMWEYGLYIRGWNDLKKEDKKGFVIGYFEMKTSGVVVVDIFFPAIEWIADNVYLDEIVPVKDE